VPAPHPFGMGFEILFSRTDRCFASTALSPAMT
jgi:hypothetical protein